MIRVVFAVIHLFMIVSCSSELITDTFDSKEVFSYFKKQKDREKYLAAKFLIDNMHGHLCMQGDYISCYSDLRRVLSNTSLSISALQDSILFFENKWSKAFNVFPVEKVITSEYLIHDIEEAFTQWKKGEWSRHLDFGHFCEYILPFTCSDYQPIFSWRDSLKSFAYGSIGNLSECYDYKNDPRSAIASVNSFLKQMVMKQRKAFRAHEVPIFDPELFVKFPNAASCSENAEIVTLILRSKGLPVAIDYTPQWPDREGGHEWCALWSVHGKTEQFNPFTSNPGYTSFQHQRISKVFRKTYAENKCFSAKLKRHPELIETTGTSFFVDVTKEYTNPKTISVKINRVFLNKQVYLAVFDNEKWRPIWYGKAVGRRARFKDVGSDVMYIAMTYHNKTGFTPISCPFHLDRLGRVSYVEPKISEKCNYRIKRKFPMHQHVFLVSTLRNGIIEASNDKQKWDTIKMLPKWPLTSGCFDISSNEEYRYWRFTTKDKRVSDMAEIFFYSSDIKKPIINYSVIDAHNGYEKLFDGDLLSYYSARGHDYYGSVDFGYPLRISRIEYVLRGDGNAIMPGDDYEVSWWNRTKWEVLLKDRAQNVWLDVDNAPKDALFFIRDLSSGSENRIFQYVNNEIIWH